MENSDGKIPFSSYQMSASTRRPPSRRSKNSQKLHGFAFNYLVLVSLTTVFGSSEGRFQQTSQPGFFASFSIDQFSAKHAGELTLNSPSLGVPRNVSAASTSNNLDEINLDLPPYKVSVRSKLTDDSELPVLNLTQTTIRFSQNWENDDVIMGLSSGDTVNLSKKRYVSKRSESASVEKKRKELRKYLKARVSSEPNIISVDDNFERRASLESGRYRLAFLKDLKGLTKSILKPTTSLYLPSERQYYETTNQRIETSTESIIDGGNLSANSGGRSIEDMFGMIRRLRKSTALPQSEASDAIQSRSRKEQDSTTIKPSDHLSSAFRKFLKEGVRLSTVNLRVGSLANDSIGLLHDNKTSYIDSLSIRSNTFVADGKSVSTSVLTGNPSSESATSPGTTRVVDLKPTKGIHTATSSPIVVKNTSFPILKVENKTVLQHDAPLKITEVTSTTTVVTTPRSVLTIHKIETLEQSGTTSPIINHTENLPTTESLQMSSSFPPRKLISTSEKLEFQKFTTQFTEKTSINIQTSPQPLTRSSTKASSVFQLITDDQGWEQNSTSTPETPRAGPIVEKEPLLIYADTAGLTVCLVILCVGLLLFVVGIYFVCQSSKPRDSDDNVQPYSARRFSDA